MPKEIQKTSKAGATVARECPQARGTMAPAMPNKKRPTVHETRLRGA